MEGQCGEPGHVSGVCPKNKQGNGTLKASTFEVLMKEEGNSKGANLSYAWGKVRELDGLLIF